MQNTHYYMTNAKHIPLISFQMSDKSGTLNIDEVGPEKLIAERSEATNLDDGSPILS